MRRCVSLATALTLAALGAIPTAAGGGQPRIIEEPIENAQTRPEYLPSPYTELTAIKLEAENLYGLAVDRLDRLFVSIDRSVLILDPGGRPIGRVELEQEARCLAVGPAGLMYLGMSDHVEVYNQRGQRLAIWAGLGHEALITSIAAQGDEVLVADAGNRMILRYDSGGRLLDYILGDGSNGPELLIPSPYFDLLLTPDGTLWVTNPGAHHLQSYSSNGGYLGSWGFSGTGIAEFGGCCNPTHIALTPAGSILTSEKGIPRVKEYDAGGNLIALVAGAELFAEGTTGLDLATDSRGRIVVLDPISRAVRIFASQSEDTQQ